jgi:uncharacterized protein (TIGR03437 family)
LSQILGGNPTSNFVFEAKVDYAGPAPGEIAGLLQVNLEIPAGLATGPQPLVVTVGGVTSQSGLTVAVK